MSKKQQRWGEDLSFLMILGNSVNPSSFSKEQYKNIYNDMLDKYGIFAMKGIKNNID